jgi:hypothetical protein
MNALKKELYQLVDALPKREWKTAKKILVALLNPEQEECYRFPYDDESIDLAERRAIEAGQRAIREGRTKSLEQVARAYGL